MNGGLELCLEENHSRWMFTTLVGLQQIEFCRAVAIVDLSMDSCRGLGFKQSAEASMLLRRPDGRMTISHHPGGSLAR